MYMYVQNFLYCDEYFYYVYVAVSPCQYSYAETLSTLRYASRAKNIINKPKINEVRILIYCTSMIDKL